MATQKKRRAKKAAVKPTDRRRRNFNAVLWSVPMSVEWSGLSRDHIVGFIEAGEVESVAVGPEHDRIMPGGKMGTRTCAKYLIVAESLKKLIETLAARGRLLKRSA